MNIRIINMNINKDCIICLDKITQTKITCDTCIAEYHFKCYNKYTKYSSKCCMCKCKLKIKRLWYNPLTWKFKLSNKTKRIMDTVSKCVGLSLLIFFPIAVLLLPSVFVIPIVISYMFCLITDYIANR